LKFVDNDIATNRSEEIGIEIGLIKYWPTKERKRNTKGVREVNEGGRGSGQSPRGRGSEETVDF